jgi:hypothetical protein
VIALRGGQTPGHGHRIDGTVPHDKISAAARKRMAETGEPYAAARRAVANERQGGTQLPVPDTGYVLRMSGEIHDWLADLRDSNPRAARRVTLLEGPVVESRFPEAVMASADMLRRVRAGQAPEATTHGYDNSWSFLDELYPGNVGDASTMSAAPRDTPGIRD